MKLVMIRHGATEWSQAGRHTGRTDLPLLEEGRDEARALVPLVRGVLGSDWPGRVVSSPLSRARETASLVFGEGPIELSPDLMEMDYGEYEGRTREQIRAEHPAWDVFKDGCPGGETIEDVGARCDAFLASVRADPRPVCAVAHGHLLRVLGARSLGLPAEEGRMFELSTATVSCVDLVRGKMAVRLWNASPTLWA